MKIDVKGELCDVSAMLLSAERYALGRQTYIVEWTCSFIKNNLHLITGHDKQVMIKDIEQCENYGWECDEKEWKALLAKMKGQTNENTKNN